VAALIVVMVALSIAGSAWWRPQPISRETLPLGGVRPVRNAPRLAEESISSVLESVGPSLAFLTVPEFARSGSGVVVHADGFVVTNAHVVEGAHELLVAFDDDEPYNAVVYGIDRSTDLAVVKVDADHPLPAAPLGDSDELRVGEFVVALGAPFGLEATATSGIVSGLHRSGLGIARFEDFIVTDAPINRGNSGGPLVNLRGEVVGINTAIIADDAAPHGTGTFSGVGFAIPVNVMRVVAQRLIGDGGAGLSGAVGARESAGVDLTAVGGERGSGAAQRSEGRQGLATAVARRTSGGQEGVEHPAPRSVALVQRYDARGVRFPEGTGFVISVDGELNVVTNEHVVRGASHLEVFFASHGDPGYFSLPGVLRDVDRGRDLALISIPQDERLHPLQLGDGDALAVGDAVFSLGARLDQGSIDIARPTGHVTETGLSGWMTLDAVPWARVVATDLGVEPGDSGGPLLDASGAVVGIVFGRDPSAAADARRSYAVVFRADHELELLVDPGFDPGFEPNFPFDEPVIRVSELQPDGLARAWGLRVNDRIVAIDDSELPEDATQRNEIWEALLRRQPGSEVVLWVERAGSDAGARESIPVTIPDHSPTP